MDEQNASIEDRLISIMKRILGSAVSLPDPFPQERQLSELGVSSLKMVNLMLMIEMDFDVTIPESELNPENFQSLKTLQALVARIVT